MNRLPQTLPFLIVLALALVAAPCVVRAQPAVAGPAQAQPPSPTYGSRLEGYDYPYAVGVWAFDSQRQRLEMTFMDVAPTGPSNGRTAVLLHGKNFCAATWGPTIEVLAEAGYRVVAIDQVGFCKASKPQAYQFSLAQLATNTKGLLDHLGIERAMVVGHSMGGMLAARFAIQHPQAVERLVMVNPIGLEDWQAEGVPYAPLDAAFANERRTTFESIKAYQQKFYYGGEWRAEYDAPVTMLAGMYRGPEADAVAWNQAQTSDMIFTQPVVHEFGRITARTTVIIGETDRTAPGADRTTPEVRARLGLYPELGPRTVQAISGAKLVRFPDLGHAPQIQEPARFHAALLTALAD